MTMMSFSATKRAPLQYSSRLLSSITISQSPAYVSDTSVRTRGTSIQRLSNPTSTSYRALLWKTDQRRWASATSSNAADEQPQQQELTTEAKKSDGEGADAGEETKPRRISEVPIADVLTAKHSYRWVDPVIADTSTVRAAVSHTIDGGLGGMMVVSADRRVVGLITSRDLLRSMARGFKEPTEENVFDRVVADFMTPIRQVIYARPDETVGMCRAIMAKLGLKCLPILEGNQVKGLITARDMSDFGLKAMDKGGKEAYLSTVSSRVGLSSHTTSMAEPPPFLQAHLALDQAPLFAHVGSFALPHPFKTADGRAGRNRKDIQQSDYTNDPELSEDAKFVCTVQLPDEQNHALRPFTYVGVADGVGSWREYGVDPRQFSKRLMQECENILLEATGGEAESTGFRQVISPATILAQAYERVKVANIIGSSTACVALFDGLRHQLHFSNLGDCGLIVLRHIDSDVAGALRRDRSTPRSERKSDLKLTFVSQQQLRKFNHPYQLGWTGEELPDDEETSFRDARDSCTSSIHVRRGDIVIMATDGLFDNVDMDDLLQLCLEWETRNGFIKSSGDMHARERRWSRGESLAHVSVKRIQELAETLVQRARSLSVDQHTDSPFAILAKENDIMWSGGMPDDCTCIALHVTGTDGSKVQSDGAEETHYA